LEQARAEGQRRQRRGAEHRRDIKKTFNKSLSTKLLASSKIGRYKMFTWLMEKKQLS